MAGGKERSGKENLLEFGDRQSRFVSTLSTSAPFCTYSNFSLGNHFNVDVVVFVCVCVCYSVSSNIAQAFLHPMLEAFLHPDLQVRFGAVQAVLLILRQGLVHPAQVNIQLH